MLETPVAPPDSTLALTFADGPVVFGVLEVGRDLPRLGSWTADGVRPGGLVETPLGPCWASDDGQVVWPLGAAEASLLSRWLWEARAAYDVDDLWWRY